MLVVLKIPMVYLAAVVWWAIRAEPRSRRAGDRSRVRPSHPVRLGRAPPSPFARGRACGLARAGPVSRPVRRARARVGAQRERGSVPPSADRVAGFLCAFSFALSGIALARNPGLLAPAAIVVALVAVRMTHAHRTLAAVAVIAGALAFLVGMIIAISTDSPLY